MAADIRVSIPRLLTLIGPFIAIVCFQAVLAFVSLEVLSSVRAYIAGEGLWTKGQKDAIYFLNLYAETGEPQFYDRYKVAVAVPLADRRARHALELSPPDVDAARSGFIGGGNHVDDVDGLIWLFRNFRNISYFDRSVSQWIASDPILDELVTLGDDVHAEVATSPTTRDRTAAKAEIAEINRRLTLLATAFSESLGEASRWIKLILVIANFLAATLLVALTIWWSRYFLRQQHAYEAALRAEKERAQATLASLGKSVISTDVAGRVVYMNAAAERLLRVSNETARGKALTSLFHLKCQETGVTTDIFAEDEAAAANAFQLIERADGTSVAVSIATTSLHASDKGVSNVVVIHDRTNEQEFLARLSWQASHDELTELPNRREFERRLQIAIEELGTNSAGHALMFLDLDQFKVVNDTCGHAAGDQLLRQVARRAAQAPAGDGPSGPPGWRRVCGIGDRLRRRPRPGRCREAPACRRADEFRLGKSELPCQREHRAHPHRRRKHDGSGGRPYRGRRLLPGEGKGPQPHPIASHERCGIPPTGGGNGLGAKAQSRSGRGSVLPRRTEDRAARGWTRSRPAR